MTTKLTQAEIDVLEKAIASGVTRVTFNGRTVEYASFKSLQARHRWLKSQIDQVQDGKKRVARYTKGVTT